MRDAILLVGLPGSWEWIVILVIFLVLFGRRVPRVMRSLGESIGQFRRGIGGAAGEKEATSNKRE